jgi:hypothetical protein
VKNVLLAAAGVGGLAVVALVGAIVMQPDVMHIERSRVVESAPKDLWPQVADLKAFVAWSPWSGLDPNQVVEFSDPAAGVGAWYTWKGNSDVGSGKMSITGGKVNARVEHDLEFIEPFASTADVSITLTEEALNRTKVTWAMDSKNDFMGKAFGLFVDMDAMLGADFDKGLASLATRAEAATKDRLQLEKAKAEVEAELAAALAAAAAAPAPVVVTP